MATFLIYDKATGRAVQTHIQPDDLEASRDSILAHVGAPVNRDQVEFVPIGVGVARPEVVLKVDAAGTVLPEQASGEADTGDGMGRSAGLPPVTGSGVGTRYVPVKSV